MFNPPTETQRGKAADVLASCLSSKVSASARKTFRTTLIRVTEVKGLNTFGYWTSPDKYITAALKKAKLADSDFSTVIIVTFEPNDLITVFKDGEMTEH
jgi:hypothetical protein